MARKAFTEHPEFMRFARVANEAVITAASELHCLDELGSSELHGRTDRIVDDLTRLLLASYDATQRRRAA